ncbi:putative molluscan insulin-related peptide(s) receptor [Amphibalanus amphitrite]|uniref:Putative molluscan insulin-related peptide(S) receptor n=1 Tax=Amphibalanus amphitrite TaxID=1232801 RepID=A0A6A4VU36_AMPAM|nr:putative molluscan insulin-related peptide(s) receptor [Amphibalanus amphitrite]
MGDPLDIRLQVSDRPGSLLIAWVFKLFLREMYGYRNTSLVLLPDRFSMDDYLTVMSDCPRENLACQDQTCDSKTFSPPCHIPSALINLQAWTPASYDLDFWAHYNVLYAGRLGPETRIGWFLQERVSNSSRSIVDHWRAFQHPETARVFNYTDAEVQRLRRHLWDGHRPVLFAHHAPSPLTLHSSYVEVAFPPCLGGSTCPTGARYLKKLAWSGLKEAAGLAYKALADFRLSQSQFEELMALSTPSFNPGRVACDWMRRNNITLMEQWLSRIRPTNMIYLGGIFPIMGSSYQDPGVIPAVMMAIDAINRNTSLLSEYKMDLLISDGQCSADMVMKTFINYLRMPIFPQMAGVPSAEGVLLTNRTQYPYFFRTIGENKQFRFVYKQLLKQLQFKRVASLTEAGQKVLRYLKDLREQNARIIIADMYQVAARAIMCEAYHQNMTAKEGYLWFLPEWFSGGWFNTPAFSGNNKRCSIDQIMQVLVSARLVELLNVTDFHGVSGHLRFVGPSRVSVTEVKQWRRDGDSTGYHVVGRFYPDHSIPEGGRLEMDESKIRWLTPNGLRPVDGSSPPCDLQPLADLLDISCQDAMIVANVVGLLPVILLFLICALFYKRRYERKMLRLQEMGLGNWVAYSPEWELKRENIVTNRKLGEGAFGTVYGGEALLVKDRERGEAGGKPDKKRVQNAEQPEEWCSVAVKTLKLNATLEEKQDFLREADIMKGFDHTNIVRLLGVCTLAEPLLTVMEFMLHGDLKTFLLSRRNPKDECGEISDKNLTSMARDVACALSYLADRKFVHRCVGGLDWWVRA